MKKIVSLAVVCILLLSSFAITAFAADKPSLVYTASEIVDGKFTLDVSSTEDQTTIVYGALGFDPAKVALLNADGTAVTTTQKGSAYTGTSTVGTFQSASAYFNTAGELYFGFTASDPDGVAAGETLVTLYFEALDTITEDPFYIIDSTSANWTAGWKINTRCYGGVYIATKTAGTFDNKSGAGNAAISVDATNIITTVVEEPDFSVTLDGTTITCAGKVAATVTNYGVEFTAESTVEGARAQKYYGAMNGATVKDYNGSTTFNFDGWDGTFEIILEGVHAGAKEVNFFSNDTIIADTNFTVVVE